MPRYRSYSVAFKRQIAEEFLSGHETLHGLSRKHDISRNLIRVWITKYEAGQFDEEVELASMLEEYEARIAALERKVGQLTMENDLLKKASEALRRPRDVMPSVVSGPKASPSPRDAAP